MNHYKGGIFKGNLKIVIGCSPHFEQP